MKKIVITSAIAIGVLMAVSALYACDPGTCDYTISMVEPETYCICLRDRCVGFGWVEVEYVCEKSVECGSLAYCATMGFDPETHLMTYGEIVCYSTHVNAPWCGVDTDCSLESYINSEWIDEPICACKAL